jgi:hypothetical protein
MKFRIITLVFSLCALTALTTSVRLSAQEQKQQPSYTPKPTITEFNAPHAGSGSGQGTVPQGNNPAGAITGYYIDTRTVYHGFLRTPDGTITSFDPPGSGTLKGSSQGTVPLSINSLGEIVGQYQDENYLYHGFLRAPDGTFTTIDSPGAGTEAGLGTIAENIGPEGLIAGFYLDANNVYHGFVRARDGAITTFDAPGAGTGSQQGTLVTSTEAGINREGAIIGWYIDSDNVYHGYLRSPDGSTFTTIDGPDAAYTILAGLTPAGAVAGYFGDASNVGHGLLFADGTLTTFDDPKAGTGNNQGTFVFNINPEGAITGQYTDAGNTNHGFVRAPDGKFTTFDAPHAAGGNIAAGTRPETINRAGAITGYYIDTRTVAHGFLWTP